MYNFRATNVQHPIHDGHTEFNECKKCVWYDSTTTFTTNSTATEQKMCTSSVRIVQTRNNKIFKTHTAERRTRRHISSGKAGSGDGFSYRYRYIYPKWTGEICLLSHKTTADPCKKTNGTNDSRNWEIMKYLTLMSRAVHRAHSAYNFSHINCSPFIIQSILLWTPRLRAFFFKFILFGMVCNQSITDYYRLSSIYRNWLTFAINNQLHRECRSFTHKQSVFPRKYALPDYSENALFCLGPKGCFFKVLPFPWVKLLETGLSSRHFLKYSHGYLWYGNAIFRSQQHCLELVAFIQIQGTCTQIRIYSFFIYFQHGFISPWLLPIILFDTKCTTY